MQTKTESAIMPVLDKEKEEDNLLLFLLLIGGRKMPNGNGFLYMLGVQILFFIITIILIIWLVRNNRQNQNITARELLEKRLASGEINQEEYDKIIKKIRKSE